jgi:deoxycytidylate deaminase
MDDPAPTDLRSHKLYRLIYDDVVNHPFRDELCSLHGTVIVRGGSVLSVALNHPGRSAFSDSYSYHAGFTIHSELNAIKKVRRKIDLTGASCYNLRIDKHGQIKTSKPCPSCERLLINYGFKKVHHTTDSGELATMKLSQIRMLEAA